MESISIPGKDLVPIIKDTLKSGSDFKLLVTGDSMNPLLINNRDSVLLTAVSNIGIKKGQIVLIQRDSGDFVLHRVIKVLKNNKFIMNGDAQTWTEIVRNEQVIAIVKTIYRKKLIIQNTDILYKLIINIWILLRPLRPLFFKSIFKAYVSMKRLFK